MADLGEAVLRLTVDDTALRQGLNDAKRLIEQEVSGATERGARRTTRRTAVSTPAGGIEGPGGVNERDLVRRFNLRGVVRSLETLSTELSQIQTGRTLNIGASWGRALDTLTDISNGLTQIAAGQKVNLNTSWGIALQALSEIDTDLRSVAAGERLNLNTSWSTALQTLGEIDNDLKLVAAGERLNLKASWNSALRALAEIDTDLKAVAAGRKLNIDSNWALALRQLSEIDTDLRTIAAGKKLNLKASWNKFFQDAEQVRKDIRESGTKARKQSASQKVKLQKEVAANALIGAGFPLLFGQGVGAALGGGLGGAAGALGGGTFGFAGSIAGTALGAAFDTAILKAQELSVALDAPVKSFDLLKQNATLSSKPVEKYAEALIEAGRDAEAAVVIQQDLAKTYGDLAAAKEIAEANDELARSWSQLSVTLAGLFIDDVANAVQGLARALQGFKNVINAVKQALPQGQPQNQPQQQAGFNAASAVTSFIPGINVLGAAGSFFSAFGSDAQKAQQDAKSLQELEQKLFGLRVQNKKELSDSYKLITASVQQNKAALQAAKEQEVINKRNQQLRKLAAQGVTDQADPRVQKINQDAALEQFRIREEAIQEEKNTRKKNLETLKKLTLDQADAVKKGAESAKDAAAALAEAAKRARAAVVEFTAVRSDPQGLNRFLGQNVINRRAQEDLQTLLPQFRRAQESFRALTGERAPEFAGRTSDVNAAIRDFIKSVDAEQQARENIGESLKGVTESTTKLTETNAELLSAIKELTGKDWDVKLDIINQAGGASTVNAVNGLLQ